MSSTSKNSVPISSFSSPYVPLDLVSYMKSGKIMPFHIFNRIVMPDFLHHLSNERKSLPSSSSSSSDDRAKELPDLITEEVDLSELLEEIQENVIHIHKACGRLEEWETDVNLAINQLVLQSLDDAYKDKENPVSPNFPQNKFRKMRANVLKLKEQIYSPLKFSTDNLDSESFKTSKYSVTRSLDHTVNSPDQKCLSIAEISPLIDVRGFYDDLDPTEKKCLLCFSVFPENAVIKKKVLVHWWIGEEFVDYFPSCEDKSAEKIADIFKKFIKAGIIEPVYKKQRPSPDSCKMQPFVRNAVIEIAEEVEFAEFDADKNPTANISLSKRPCLVKTEEGLSMRDFTYGFQSKQDKVQMLFNVSERRLEFKVNWFSKMTNVKVLQLGKWQSSASHLIEVEDSEFLKGLKKMKFLRYLSLRGVSRITELPSSICKLGNLRILNLNGCHDLEKLPDGIGSLKKLTHLDMYECSLISHMPKGIAQLSELQILKGFVVAEPKSGDDYCRLAHLTKLKNLKKLSVHVDRKFSGPEKGKRELSLDRKFSGPEKGKRELSPLSQFKNLESLSISWSRIYNSEKQEKVIQKVISQAKRLTSIERSSVKMPSDSSSLPAKLKKLDLHYFPGLKISDWFWLGQVQDLRKLYVRGGNLIDLRSDKCFWKGVKFLRLKFLSNLQMDWGGMQELFPELIYLEKSECPLLSSFPCDKKSGVWKKESGTT